MANTALEVRPLKIRNVTSNVPAFLGRFKRGENMYHLRTHTLLNTRLFPALVRWELAVVTGVKSRTVGHCSGGGINER